MHRFLAALWWAGVVALFNAAPTWAAPSPSGPDLDFFEKRVRPVLAEHCYSCHSASSEKLKAGLRLDSRAGILKGGESGPAAVSGDPEGSLLIKAIHYTDADLQMPPRKGKLPEAAINDLTEWIRRGLPWPEGESAAPKVVKRAFEITAQDRAYWAFQPIRRPALPAIHDPAWAANGIDYFVRARLEEKGLTPARRATARELVRRVYFDLIGLPPSPSEVRAFEENPSPAAYAELIDRLLARPEFGERWGRHWLDVVRYAQSNGYERDGEKPLAWRYRDYVVNAFNQDKPFTRFIEEQIAGDELPDATADSVVATGFQRLGVWDDEPDDKAMAEFDELDDIVSTTGSAFLGLTLGCARCHDHKFDPISQVDYYQLLAFFRNLRPNDNARYDLDSPNYLPLAAPARVRAWRQEQERQIQTAESEIACTIEGPDKRLATERLAKLKAEKPPFGWALAARERGPKPLPTHVLIRGNVHSPGPEVQPAFLTVLGGARPELAPVEANGNSGARRLALARWIASPDNPLTARVAVNRVWHHHFGQGLVKTTSDFGHAGTPPTHPDLLDWLASEFIRSGWSLKQLHRSILLSSTYQMSSRAEDPQALALDPGDSLLWHQRLRRLEAEEVRDAILSVSGELNPKMGGRGFFPRLDSEVLAGESRPGADWELSSPAELARRSLYIYVRRTMLVPLLEAFDYNNTSSPLAERPTTTVAPQALMLLNSDWTKGRADAFASRLASTPGCAQDRVRLGFELAFGRPPYPSETEAALRFLQSQSLAAQKTRARLTFRPDVPNSLFSEYMDQLKPADFLHGPQPGWTYYRGRWSGAYEGIRSMDRARGPFALWTAHRFQDGVIDAQFVLQRAAESASLLFRSNANQDEQRGLELVLDPRQQRLVLRLHGKTLEALAEKHTAIPTAKPIYLRVHLGGPRLQAWVQLEPWPSLADQKPGQSGAEPGPPLLDVAVASSEITDGFVGIRSAGAALNVDALAVRTGSESFDLASASAPAAEARESDSPALAQGGFDPAAWRSFCLLLLNLNEFVYVD